ncbi:MAG: iron ABC transporter substrate-binding protein, partial [Pseudoxanthomonas suwonensis]
MNRLLITALAGTTALPLAAGAAAAAEVNIYSHRQPELIQPLLDAFTKQTGIPVNI